MKHLGCEASLTVTQSPVQKKALAKLNYTSENDDDDDDEEDIVKLSKTQHARRIPLDSSIQLLERNKLSTQAKHAVDRKERVDE